MAKAGHLQLIDLRPLSALIPTTMLIPWPAQKAGQQEAGVISGLR